MALAILQVVVSITIIILVLLQERAGGAGALFGGGGEAGYHTRRGFDKFAYNATIILMIVFGALALFNLFL